MPEIDPNENVKIGKEYILIMLGNFVLYLEDAKLKIRDIEDREKCFEISQILTIKCRENKSMIYACSTFGQNKN